MFTALALSILPMKITVEIENNTQYPLRSDIFEDLSSLIAENEELDDNASLSLIIVNSEFMKELNLKWRGRNSATDVLAFPCEFSESGFLGDIIIDIETASQQKGNNSMIYEIEALFIHGMLHLLGYDHLSRCDADEMHEKEDKYRKFIKE